MLRNDLSDPAPHNRNRLGYWLGFLFHPVSVFIPALLVVLKDASLGEVLGWVTFMAVIIITPAWIIVQVARRHGQYIYQRGVRRPVYLVFWLSMILCVGLAVHLGAPYRLIFSLMILCVWGPLQYLVNARCTKISAHVGVITGILTTFLVLGDLNRVPLVIGAVAIILATAWARVVTGHHTLLQVSLGAGVSVVAVLLTWSLMTVW